VDVALLEDRTTASRRTETLAQYTIAGIRIAACGQFQRVTAAAKTSGERPFAVPLVASHSET